MADDPPKGAPIEAQEYLFGVTVVDIGDYRVSRGMTRRPYSGCSHHRLSYDNNERRIWCRDCECDVEPFDAFSFIVSAFDKAEKAIILGQAELKSAETHKIRSLAARAMDKAWRSRTMIPACPHCHQGIFPADVRSGVSMIGKDYAEALLARKSDD